MAPLPRNEVLLVTVDERSCLLASQHHHALQDDDDVEEAAHPQKNLDATLPLPVGVLTDREEDANRSYCSRGWTAYNHKLERWPLLVKSLTAFFLLGLADACAQGCQHLSGTTATTSTMSWDWLRSLRFGVFGLVGAPWSHYYFDVLDFLLPPTPNNPCSWVTFLKLFIDQFLQAPLLLGLIIVVLHAMEGQGCASIVHDLQDHYWTTLVANCTFYTVLRGCVCGLWIGLCHNDLFAYTSLLTMPLLSRQCHTGKLWLPASFVNLAFVKPSLRVLFENVVFFVWTIILSVILHS